MTERLYEFVLAGGQIIRKQGHLVKVTFVRDSKSKSNLEPLVLDKGAPTIGGVKQTRKKTS